jgi:hypothetical protein
MAMVRADAERDVDGQLFSIMPGESQQNQPNRRYRSDERDRLRLRDAPHFEPGNVRMWESSAVTG